METRSNSLTRYFVLVGVLVSVLLLTSSCTFGNITFGHGPVCNPLNKECDKPPPCCPNLICRQSSDDSGIKMCIQCIAMGSQCWDKSDCCSDPNGEVDCVQVGEDFQCQFTEDDASASTDIPDE